MTTLLPAVAFLVTALWSSTSRSARLRRTYRRPSIVAPDNPSPRVVVVDDDPAITALVCSILQDARIEATACHLSTEAVPCIKAQQPHIVLLDMQMPKVNGIQVFKRLQHDAATSTIPVIFLSANAPLLKPHLPELNALGVRLLHKPFTSDELLAMVGTVLRIGHANEHHEL